MPPIDSFGGGKPTTNVSLYTDSSKWGYSHLKENFLRDILRHDMRPFLWIRATLWGR